MTGMKHAIETKQHRDVLLLIGRVCSGPVRTPLISRMSGVH